MSPPAARIAQLLGRHTPFGEAIVRRQAERAGFDSEQLTEHQLRQIGPEIITAASTFVDPAVLEELAGALESGG